MPHCIRCQREVDSNIENVSDWLALEKAVGSSNCYILTPYICNGNNKIFHPPAAYFWLGLCPDCQLSPKQIENIRRE